MAAAHGGLGGTRGLVVLRMLLGNLGITLLPDQIAIAKYLDEATAAIDEQSELIEKKIALLTEMRASVIHEAVTKGIPAAH
jgi:hypothetical protein